jgi:hypothetical protein
MPDTAGGRTQRSADREALRYCVQRAIFCEITGQVLDVRRAVALITELPSGQKSTIVMTAATWDERKGALFEALPDLKARMLDGRELFGRPGTRKPRGARPATAPRPQMPPRAPRPSGPAPRL